MRRIPILRFKGQIIDAVRKSQVEDVPVKRQGIFYEGPSLHSRLPKISFYASYIYRDGYFDAMGVKMIIPALLKGHFASAS